MTLSRGTGGSILKPSVLNRQYRGPRAKLKIFSVILFLIDFELARTGLNVERKTKI